MVELPVAEVPVAEVLLGSPGTAAVPAPGSVVASASPPAPATSVSSTTRRCPPPRDAESASYNARMTTATPPAVDTLSSLNPATGDVVGTVPITAPDELAQALAP